MVLDITESLGCRPSLILDGNTANNSGYSIISLVSLVLGKIIEGNYSINPAGDSLVQESFIKFQSSYEPNVLIDAYLERIHRYSKCSDSCFILMLIYVDRLIEKKSLILTKLNVHRILITTMMVAAKYHDDLFYNNAYFAKLGGLALSELNNLEVELLHALEFSMFASANEYEKYWKQLQNSSVIMQLNALQCAQQQHLQQQQRFLSTSPSYPSSPSTALSITTTATTTASCCSSISSLSSFGCGNAFQFSPHDPQQQQEGKGQYFFPATSPNTITHHQIHSHSQSAMNMNPYHIQNTFKQPLSTTTPFAPTTNTNTMLSGIDHNHGHCYEYDCDQRCYAFHPAPPPSAIATNLSDYDMWRGPSQLHHHLQQQQQQHHYVNNNNDNLFLMQKKRSHAAAMNTIPMVTVTAAVPVSYHQCDWWYTEQANTTTATTGCSYPSTHLFAPPPPSNTTTMSLSLSHIPRIPVLH